MIIYKSDWTILLNHYYTRRKEKNMRRFPAPISRQWLYKPSQVCRTLYAVSVNCAAHNCMHQFKHERSVQREIFYFRNKSWSDMHKLDKMQFIWRTRLKLLIWHRYVFHFALSVRVFSFRCISIRIWSSKSSFFI